MKHLEALIGEGGEITLGAKDPVECAATAAVGQGQGQTTTTRW